jgi:hypothetical protein
MKSAKIIEQQDESPALCFLYRLVPWSMPAQCAGDFQSCVEIHSKLTSRGKGEWDPIKNQQLGQIFSRPTEEQHPNDDSPPSNIEAGTPVGSGSYLAICPTTIQSLSSGQTLFVWQAQFHPGIGCRSRTPSSLSSSPCSKAQIPHHHL